MYIYYTYKKQCCKWFKTLLNLLSCLWFHLVSSFYLKVTSVYLNSCGLFFCFLYYFGRPVGCISVLIFYYCGFLLSCFPVSLIFIFYFFGLYFCYLYFCGISLYYITGFFINVQFLWFIYFFFYDWGIPMCSNSHSFIIAESLWVLFILPLLLRNSSGFSFCLLYYCGIPVASIYVVEFLWVLFLFPLLFLISFRFYFFVLYYCRIRLGSNGFTIGFLLLLSFHCRHAGFEGSFKFPWVYF